MNITQRSEALPNSEPVSSRMPTLLSSHRKPGEIVCTEPEPQMAFINAVRMGPAIGLDQRQANIVMRAELVIPDQCKASLKTIMTPFAFILGSVGGVFYGLFKGAGMGAQIVQEITDDCVCGACTTILMAPLIAVFYVVMMFFYVMCIGVLLGLIGALTGGYLCCYSMWNGELFSRGRIEVVMYQYLR